VSQILIRRAGADPPRDATSATRPVDLHQGSLGKSRPLFKKVEDIVILKRTCRFAIAGFAGAILLTGCISLAPQDDANSTMAAMHKSCMAHAAATAEPAGQSAQPNQCPMMKTKSATSPEGSPDHEH
jgi:hypothetical protein